MNTRIISKKKSRGAVAETEIMREKSRPFMENDDSQIPLVCCLALLSPPRVSSPEKYKV